jgi:hypothetical protein
MTSSVIDTRTASASNIAVSDEYLTVELADGRTLSVPLTWYPRLWHATAAERGRWRLVGAGEGIHWPDLDEDISIESLLLGRRSGESQASLKRWLEERKPSREMPSPDITPIS